MSDYYTSPKYGVAVKEGSSSWIVKLNDLNQILTDSDLEQLQNEYREYYAPNAVKWLLFLEVDTNYIAQNPLLLTNIDDLITGYQTSPPSTEPNVGTKYIVKTTGLSGWASQDEKLAVYINTANPYDPTDATQWAFLTPSDGYVVQNKADDKVYEWSSAISAQWGEL
jgi:hypothetical protein